MTRLGSKRLKQHTEKMVEDNIEKVSIIRQEKPNSYEFGKSVNRHKIYYAEVSELQAILKALKEAKLTDDE